MIIHNYRIVKINIKNNTSCEIEKLMLVVKGWRGYIKKENTTVHCSFVYSTNCLEVLTPLERINQESSI